MPDTDPLWYKDAIIYQLHIKAFFDSDNDGTGDFAGLIQKLDYITELGVTAIWVLPFYPSPCVTTATTSPNTRPSIPVTAGCRTFAASCARPIGAG
nr:alpha-amylase family glycosyl hydrolase [Kineobactrum salinum]